MRWVASPHYGVVFSELCWHEYCAFLIQEISVSILVSLLSILNPKTRMAIMKGESIPNIFTMLRLFITRKISVKCYVCQNNSRTWARRVRVAWVRWTVRGIREGIGRRRRVHIRPIFPWCSPIIIKSWRWTACRPEIVNSQGSR